MARALPKTRLPLLLRSRAACAVWALLGVLLIAPMLGRASDNRVLDPLDESLPFRQLRGIRRSDIFHIAEHRGRSFATMDVQGDGIDELFVSKHDALQCMVREGLSWKVIWQIPAEAAYTPASPREAAFGILACDDIDGKGTGAIVAVATTRDRGSWRTHVLDARTGDILKTFELPGGPDRNADGLWDGYIAPRAIFHGSDGSTRLLYNATAGYDLDPRALLCLDPLTAEISWTFSTGGAPWYRMTHVADLTGNGVPEIAVVTSSVANMKGEHASGWTDHESVLFVLDADGSLLWYRVLGGPNTMGYLSSGDFYGSGPDELVAVVRDVGENRNQLLLLDGTDGSLRALRDLPVGTRHLHVIQPEDHAAPLAYLGDDGGGVSAYQLHEGELVLVADAALGAPVSALQSIPFLGASAPRIVVGSAAGDVWILDAQLEPLAHAISANSHRLEWFDRLRARNGKTDLIAQSDVLELMSFERAPSRVAWSALAIASALVTGLLVMLRIHRRRRSTMGHSPDSERAARLELLEALELTGHGELGIIRRLQRFVWQLRTLNQVSLPDEDALSRVSEQHKELRDHGLPQLSALLDKATREGLSSPSLAHSVQSLATLQRKIHALQLETAQNSAPAPLQISTAAMPALGEAVTRLDVALKSLREETNASFGGNLAAALGRVLEAHAQGLASVELHVDQELLDHQHGYFCAVGERELEFILENLVANALRAMERCEQRSLRLSHHNGSAALCLRVEDTGCGIHEKDLSRVLESRYSTREGGGAGLYRSHKILRRHGGSLRIQRTEPGRGTVLEMEVPLTHAN